MNAADWINASGSALVGRGGRPINPRMAFAAAVGKTVSRTSSSRSASDTIKRLHEFQLRLALSSAPSATPRAAPRRSMPLTATGRGYANAVDVTKAERDRILRHHWGQ